MMMLQTEVFPSVDAHRHLHHKERLCSGIVQGRSMGIHYAELFHFSHHPWDVCCLGMTPAIFASPITSRRAGTREDGGEAMPRVGNVCPCCMSQCPAECGSGTQRFPSAALPPEPERSSSEQRRESSAVNVREKSLQRSCCQGSC